MKTHGVITDQPVPANYWPETIKALCGEEIKNPRPVLMIDAQLGVLDVRSTLLICRVCAALAIAPQPKAVEYVYGVLPQEEAHRANLRSRTED